MILRKKRSPVKLLKDICIDRRHWQRSLARPHLVVASFVFSLIRHRISKFFSKSSHTVTPNNHKVYQTLNKTQNHRKEEEGEEIEGTKEGRQKDLSHSLLASFVQQICHYLPDSSQTCNCSSFESFFYHNFLTHEILLILTF